MASRSTETSTPGNDNTWPNTLGLLYIESRRFLIPILAFIILMAGLAVAARYVLPQSYQATAEIFIDPRGLQVFENELVDGQNDANAGVNYVESQIHVILSTPVLTRALTYLDAGNPAPDIEAARRTISVTRAERSYLLAVTVKAKDPLYAADFANAVVRAYIEEDAASQAGVATKLTESLASRLDILRERLATSEEQLEAYRRANNLVTTDNQLVVDQQLTAAVKALGLADEKLSASSVRHDQLLAADVTTVGTLASTEDQARLTLLFNRQIAAQEAYARLQTQLGAMHPQLQLARGQVEEVDRLLEGEIARIKTSSAIALERAEQERDQAAEQVAALTTDSTDARQSSIELRNLQDQVRSNRTLLTSFETRSREMAEFAYIDSANIRQISQAFPPETTLGVGGLILWGVAAAFLAGFVALAFLVLRVMLVVLRGMLPEAADKTPKRPVAANQSAPVVTPRPSPVRPSRLAQLR